MSQYTYGNLSHSLALMTIANRGVRNLRYVVWMAPMTIANKWLRLSCLSGLCDPRRVCEGSRFKQPEELPISVSDPPTAINSDSVLVVPEILYHHPISVPPLGNFASTTLVLNGDVLAHLECRQSLGLGRPSLHSQMYPVLHCQLCAVPVRDPALLGRVLI